MAKRKWLVAFILLLFALAVQAQDQNKQPQNTKAGQQADGKQQAVKADTTDAGNTSDNTGATGNNTGTNQTTSGQSSGTSDPRASNTPAVPQTTTSQGGSPAVLSGEKGSERDGTNNVQRASMNMAGSPAEGLELDQRNSENVDSEGQDRQQYSQDKARSAQNGDRGEINNNNRKENNALSDQNLSAKEKKTQQDAQKKSSKKKDKG